mmetsp:Transcript_4689/g.10330  ORF Transcript_4689/g.10330 Transcript_4689/m.10330 type:complete len:202 (-) Transcript_4689:104-709(-)
MGQTSITTTNHRRVPRCLRCVRTRTRRIVRCTHGRRSPKFSPTRNVRFGILEDGGCGGEFSERSSTISGGKHSHGVFNVGFVLDIFLFFRNNNGDGRRRCIAFRCMQFATNHIRNNDMAANSIYTGNVSMDRSSHHRLYNVHGDGGAQDTVGGGDDAHILDRTLVWCGVCGIGCERVFGARGCGGSGVYYWRLFGERNGCG